MKRTLAFATGVMLAAAAQSQDRADLERTPIIGQRELPKVLYIVPWKKPLPGALGGRPVASVLDEVLAPVDREVFRRQLRYHQQTQPSPTNPTPNPQPSTPQPAGAPQEKQP